MGKNKKKTGKNASITIPPSPSPTVKDVHFKKLEHEKVTSNK